MTKNRGRTRNCARQMRTGDVVEIHSAFGGLVEFQPESRGKTRKRLFFPARVFWMFLTQVLSGNISCHETLQKALAWLCFETGRRASASTAGFCKARQRLDSLWLEQIQTGVAERLEAAVDGQDLWLGRRVRIVDGSGLSMPDTEENQERFPQSTRQSKGCGFPTMRIVALFSLSTGALLRLAHGALSVSERTLFHSLWEWLEKGDIILADRGFTSFADFFFLLQRGVDSVMRNHQRRTKGVREVKRLGRRDKLVAWERTGMCPKWLEKAQWRSMPREMIVRQIDLSVNVPGFRTQKIVIVTTLLDSKKHRALDFTDLYRKRWLAELFLRDIKISIGMDVLKCKTPQMVLKEVQIYTIAYNLIRSMMFQAALEHGATVMRISFKQTADTLRQWTPVLRAARGNAEKRKELLSALLYYIASATVPDRPNRSEPRALKRRKSNYQPLTKPRRTFKETMHRNKYKTDLS